MYFNTYEEAKEAAIKQSKGRLTDCKLYIKSEVVMRRLNDSGKLQYTIGFVPENPKDVYIYNGELKND